MKYIAIDYGQKRTGIAVSDPDGRMAFPRITLNMGARDVFFAELLNLLDTEHIDAIVVGLPLHTDGNECLATRQVRNFVERLQRRTALPIYMMEEVLSSFEAESDLREAGRRGGKKLRPLIDQQAAVRILETFLNLSEDKQQRLLCKKNN